MPNELKLLAAFLVALTLFGLAAKKAQAAPLDEALELVVQTSVLVQAAHENALETARQPDWSARVRLAYQMEGTDADSEGLNMGAYLEIPLFSRKKKLAETKARYEAADTELRIREKFISDVSKITKLGTQEKEAIYLAEFHKDKLKYFENAESRGLIEPKNLWPVAKEAQTAHFKANKISTELASKIEEISRIYGHNKWKKLQLLLVAHVKQNSQ